MTGGNTLCFGLSGWRLLPAIDSLDPMKLRHSAIAPVICACALIGCAAPKTPVADETPKDPPKPEVAKPETPTALPDDGFRVGNLEALPKEAETRATNPTPVNRPPANSAVVVTPPTPPTPPAPKPREKSE
jgi:hypothetical protein